MPRQARLDAPGVLHHVMARGLDRQRIFRDDRDRENFLGRVAALSEDESWAVFAWALIPNHFHLLVRTGKRPLSRSMRSVMSGYAGYFNRRHARHGHVFQNRFKSVVCEAESYFLELVRYLHLNPVRAKIVESYEKLVDYRYTGHSALMNRVERPWQATGHVLLNFGSTKRDARRAYDEFVRAGVDQGKRPDLVGGGLLRSQGGWKGVTELQRGRESYRFDERVLGSSEFVAALMEEADRQEMVSSPRLPLEELAKRICETFELSVTALTGGGRNKRVSEVRSVLCWVWFEYLGRSGREVARYLRLSPQSVYEAAGRGAERFDIEEDVLKSWTKI